mmetsp:Transcript_45633/g.116770  ORF Transcript_45633/g.116770 Transcript_45633/m.116770 type:complete len:181 (+) Transcript_45633:203-745(+)|eukprot:jgi/Tetstr1/438871/TSEL_027380.t1
MLPNGARPEPHPQLQFVTPYPGVPIRYRGAPPPGTVLLRYEIREPGCCECENLSMGGWIAVIVLFLLCWPLCWIPFVCPGCYQKQQVPVYGAPSHLGVGASGYYSYRVPVAQPSQPPPPQPYNYPPGPAIGIPAVATSGHYAPPTAGAAHEAPSAPPFTTAYVGGPSPAKEQQPSSSCKI